MKINQRIWNQTIKVLAVSMVLTGLLYPFYQQFELAKAMLALFSPVGFILWCISMVVFGTRLFFRPYTVYTSTIPILIFMSGTVYLAYQGQSVSALLIYSLLWVIPMYTHYRDDNAPKDNVMIWLPAWFKPHHVLAIHNTLFFFGLVAIPDGIGLNYIYRWLDFAGNPQVMYELIFLMGAIGLINPFFSFKRGVVAYNYVLFCSLGILIHCGLFIQVILFQTFAWSLLPFFVAIIVLVLRFIDRFYLEDDTE